MLAAVLAGLGGFVLLYTYLVYPRLVAWLPERVPRPGPVPYDPRCTFVIAARNPGSQVARKVADLLAAAPRADVVVALDGPDAGAAAALAALREGRLEVVELPSWRGKAVALNHAVERARGEVVVFTDVRQRVQPGAVEGLVAALASPDVGAASGQLEIQRGVGRASLLEWYWLGERRLRRREAAFDSAIGLTGALYAIKRDLWRPLPEGLLLDDLWVAMDVVRGGRRVAFVPEAMVADVPTGTEATEFARKVRTLTGNYQLMAWMPWVLNPLANRVWWQFVSHKALRLLTPAASLAVVAGGLLLAGSAGWWLAGALAGAAAVVWVIPARAALGPVARLARLARGALALQAALVSALFNAVRGRWNVWADPARPSFEEGARRV